MKTRLALNVLRTLILVLVLIFVLLSIRETGKLSTVLFNTSPLFILLKLTQKHYKLIGENESGTLELKYKSRWHRRIIAEQSSREKLDNYIKSSRNLTIVQKTKLMHDNKLEIEKDKKKEKYLIYKDIGRSDSGKHLVYWK